MPHRSSVPDIVRQAIDRAAPHLEEYLRVALTREVCRAAQGRHVPYAATIETARQRELRNTRIRTAFHAGVSEKELAGRFGLSQRQVQRIVSGVRRP